MLVVSLPHCLLQGSNTQVRAPGTQVSTQSTPQGSNTQVSKQTVVAKHKQPLHPGYSRVLSHTTVSDQQRTAVATVPTALPVASPTPAPNPAHWELQHPCPVPLQQQQQQICEHVCQACPGRINMLRSSGASVGFPGIAHICMWSLIALSPLGPGVSPPPLGPTCNKATSPLTYNHSGDVCARDHPGSFGPGQGEHLPNWASTGQRASP
jgi:hypothetical protein